MTVQVVPGVLRLQVWTPRIIRVTYSPTGNLPDCLETIRAAGLDVPATVLEANWRREQKSERS